MLSFLKKSKPHLELAARIYVWAMISAYGSGKIIGGQFYRVGKIPEQIAQTPLAEVGSYDLMWTFFGHSFPYIVFIGGFQLIGGMMLLFEKTKLLGIAVLIPILLNIIVADICFSVSWGATMSATFYTCALCFVLYCNREKVNEVFQIIFQKSKWKQNISINKFIKIGIAVGIVVCIIALENQMLNIVGR